MSQIPVKEGLYKQNAEGKAALVGSYCPDCGEKFFPVRIVCAKCSGRSIQEIELAREGEIVTYTVIRQGPATWKGPIPYTLVIVKLDEGPQIESHLVDAEGTSAVIGKRAELVMDKLREDQEGNEIMVHKFRLLPEGRGN